jgi:hypothetical protein
VSDTPEPAPLTEREMSALISLSRRADCERISAVKRLRWLEAQNAALKPQADPLAEMWRELSEYQTQADRDGHGESWRRMCEERTEEAAQAAYQERQASSHVSAAAYGAWWAAQRDAAARRLSKEAVEWAANAIDAIRRAKEVKP